MILTNKLNLPQPFVSAAEDKPHFGDKRYSVTTILNGVRQIILQKRHYDEITEDVSDRVWAIFGTAVHKILEEAEETPDQIKENYVVVDLFDGYQLSGVFDLYDDSTGTVTDYKTASVWKVMFGDFENWKLQTACYCWMLREIGIDAHRGEIVALLKDHSPSKARTERNYPPYPVYTISWEFSEDELDAIGQWIWERFAEIARCEQLPDEQLPICTQEERWTKGEKWAVMKKGVKRAKKLFDSESAAVAHAEQLNLTEKGTFYVEHRKGEDGKCIAYCSACEFCDHYLQNVKEA